MACHLARLEEAQLAVQQLSITGSSVLYFDGHAVEERVAPALARAETVVLKRVV